MYDQFARNRNRNRHKHHLQPFYSKPRLAKIGDKNGESRKMSEKYLFKTRRDGGSVLQLQSNHQIVSCSCWISGEETRAEGAHSKRNENENEIELLKGFCSGPIPYVWLNQEKIPRERISERHHRVPSKPTDIWVTPADQEEDMQRTSESWRRHAEKYGWLNRRWNESWFPK